MPYREMIIVFFIILGFGAFANGMPKEEDPVRDVMETQQQPDSSKAKAIMDNPLIAVGTQDNFKDEVLSASKPVLVEFYADSDPDCNKMAPIIADVANRFQGTLKVVKVDINTNADLYKKYEIGELPGLLIFKNGVKAQALAGQMTESDLSDFLARQHVKPAETPPGNGPNASG